MSEHAQPREWVMFGRMAYPADTAPQNDGIKAIELDPLLDLLERVRARNDHADRADVEALLRAHGRLA